MTKKDRVFNYLSAAGYDPDESTLRIIKGPKVKSDILECWSVEAITRSNQKRVLITSGDTMTALRKGLKVEPNRESTCLYGDFVAMPPTITPPK